MATERSDNLSLAAVQAASTFDYFMAGLCTALLGYLIPTLKPGPLGWNPSTLELSGVALLLGAALAAFKRLEFTVMVLKNNAEMLYHQETAGSLVSASAKGGVLINESTGAVFTAEEAGIRGSQHAQLGQRSRVLTEQASGRSRFWYQVRNRLLVASFLFLMLSRIWAGYLP